MSSLFRFNCALNHGHIKSRLLSAAVTNSCCQTRGKLLCDAHQHRCLQNMSGFTGKHGSMLSSTLRTSRHLFHDHVAGPLPSVFQQGTCMQRFVSTGKQKDVTGLRLSEEVKEALHSRKPVVALESTIITHGMPYPQNGETALAVEQVIRDSGVVPATVGMLNGEVCVGLSGGDIQRLAENTADLVKISRRDFPVVMSQCLSGGTTVSGTMMAAHMAGIPIFATGGIGGVHRCVSETQDVSADLRELGRTPVAVVAAGVKSILDIPRTLEYLETEGVCVVTYGPTTDFPAFFSPQSGHKAPYNVQSPQCAADIVDAGARLQLESGILFAVPIPEEFAASGETIEAAIQEAVAAARRSNVKGKEVTPFILQRVNELTQGASLEANIALVKNNAKVAAQIAVALAEKRKKQEGDRNPVVSTTVVSSARVVSSSSARGASSSSSSSDNRIESSVGQSIVVGGAVVDFCAKVKEENVKMIGATYEGRIYQSFGGVARNLADCMSRLGNTPLFISALGDDALATTFVSGCSHMDLRGVQHVKGASTPTYCPVLTDSGHLMFGIGDMGLHSVVTPEMISRYQTEIAQSPLVAVDGNFSADVIEQVCQLCADADVPVWFEPTDVHKATKPWETDAWKHLTYISPNLNESACIWSALTGQPHETLSETSDVSKMLSTAIRYCHDLLVHIPVVMVTLGKHGLVLGHREEKRDRDSPVELYHYPAVPADCQPSSVISVSGAGDCLNAAMMHFILQGHDLDLCVKAGLLAAQYSLQSYNAVPASIEPSQFTAEKVDAWARFEASKL